MIGWLLVLVVAAAAALTLDPARAGDLYPDLAGWSVVWPFSQVIAMRPLLALAFAVVAVITLVVGLVRKIGFRGGSHTLVLGLLLLAVAALHGWIVWERGLENSGELTVDAGLRPGEQGTGEITVLTYNTLAGRTGAQDVADLARQSGADVMMLPETGQAAADEIARAMATEGATFQVFVDADEEEPTASTALLVSAALGEYVRTQGPDTSLGSVRAEPATGVGPALVAVHPAPPRGEEHERWLADLAEVTALCEPRTDAGLIMAGDLNATVDHAPMRSLGRCVDAAGAAGVGGVATWPTSTPEWLGAPIDHVLVDGRAYETTEAAVVERGDSDHRGLLVRLAPIG